MKKQLSMFFLFLVMSFIVNAATVLRYNETDHINIRPAAYDEDNDSLTYFFNPPLSRKGTWQTNYGDAGIYNTKVGVSDGRLVTYQNITLIINKKEEPPTIEFVQPKEESVYMIEGESMSFSVEAEDVNDDPLQVYWLIDNSTVLKGNSFMYRSGYYSQGEHVLEVRVSDGYQNVSKKWNIFVENFNRSKLLDRFVSFSINETERVALDLPDFAEYDLEHNISEPIGDDGKWETGYEDSGTYNIETIIYDNQGFEDSKNIKVLVENVDRAPRLVGKRNIWANENEELDFRLNFTDPDGDEVHVSAYNLPKDAELIDHTINWKPDFDTVKEENIIDDVARRYHVMNRVFDIFVNLTSKNKTTTEKINIRVFNTNRAPVLESISDLVVKEGQVIDYPLSAYDPDNDSLSYSFDKFPDGSIAEIGEAGEYIIKVTVSDGFLTDSKHVRLVIKDVNQAPRFEDLGSYSIEEGKELKIELDAKDEDGDELSYSILNIPENAYLKGDEFVWEPDFDTVDETSQKELIFFVSDGILNDTEKAMIRIKNINRKPVILTSAQIDGKEFYVGEDINLYVDVSDPDDDNLTYEWRTSMFNTFESENNINVRYDGTGSKEISVTISDGEYSVRRDWRVFVKEKPDLNIRRTG